jgi:hypothetical protein
LRSNTHTLAILSEKKTGKKLLNKRQPRKCRPINIYNVFLCKLAFFFDGKKIIFLDAFNLAPRAFVSMYETYLAEHFEAFGENKTKQFLSFVRLKPVKTVFVT